MLELLSAQQLKNRVILKYIYYQVKITIMLRVRYNKGVI